MSSANQHGMKELVSWMKARQAVGDARYGFSATARRGASEALGLPGERAPRAWAALALAEAGDMARAQTVLGALARDFPDDTSLSTVVRPVVTALDQLGRNKPAEAVVALEPTRSYELAKIPITGPETIYIRGQALLRQRWSIMSSPCE
jgi:hypothetical protein